MDTRETSQLVMDALAHAVSGNADGAATALQTIGQQSNGSEMYGVCCALAAAGVQALRSIYGDRAPQSGSAGMWVLEQLKPGALDGDPAGAFAMRFLIAYANRDSANCLALYDAAWKASDDEFVESVSALLAEVAGITRLALDQQKGENR